jgi:hypothetical protein
MSSLPSGNATAAAGGDGGSHQSISVNAKSNAFKNSSSSKNNAALMDVDHEVDQVPPKQQQQQNQNQKQAPQERTSQPALHLTSDEVNYLIYRYVNDGWVWCQSFRLFLGVVGVS